MFKIYDGREAFYQWDIDQKVVVEDRSITQVHFCNRTDDCALICECYELEGKWVADVPNILLQDNWRIRVYAYDGCATRHDEKYDVKPRSKPDTYVYTETEVLSYETIAKRMDAIETDIEGVAEEVIKEYLEEHDIKVDLTGYATEEYVDNAVSAIELTPGPAGKDGKDGKDGVDGAPGADGKDYVLTEADKQEIAGMVEVTGGGGSGESIEEVHVGNAAPTDPNIKLWVNPEEEIKYATEQYVDDAIANLDIGGGDSGAEIIYWEGTLNSNEGGAQLSNEEVAKLLESASKEVSITLKNHDDNSEITFKSSVVYDEYGSQLEFQGVDEATDGLMSYLYLYTDNNMFDTFLDNDSKIVDIKIYIPSNRDYYTRDEVDAAIEEAKPDLTEYVKKTELPNVSDYATKTEIANAGYQTAADVNAAISLAFSTLGIAEEEAY